MSFSFNTTSAGYLKVLEAMAIEDESVFYACADPLPQIITYANSVTNETEKESVPTKINSLEVVFDYKVFHTDDVTFGDIYASKGVLETISNTVSNILNGDDKKGEENLVALEKCMVDKIWKTILASDKMTWVEGSETECAGLLIDEESRRTLMMKRVLQNDGNTTFTETPEAEPIVDNAGLDQDQTQATVIDDSGASDTANVVNAAVNFTETKLIGMSSLPLDVVNAPGCSDGSGLCTSIRGVISANYTGKNENAVAESIARILQDGMNSDLFLCESSPAKKLEFDKLVGTSSSGGHSALTVNTSRGTAQPETSNTLTQYGILFVVFVALLAVGVIISVIYKRKKRKKKSFGAAAEQDYAANLALDEGSESATDENARSETPVKDLVDTVDLHSRISSDEVELSLSPKRGRSQLTQLN